MNIKSIITDKILKKTGLFDIRSFIVVFAIYSLISIWSANFTADLDVQLDRLNKEEKLFKSEYVYTKTVLMNKRKYSNLLKRGLDFQFVQQQKPIQTIYLQYAN